MNKLKTDKSKLIISFLISFLLFACQSARTIDASSGKNLRKSLNNIEENLNTNERKQFNTALLNIVAENKNWFDTFSRDKMNKMLERIKKEGSEEVLYGELLDDRVKDKIDGKTAKQIVEESEQINKDRTSSPYYYLDKLIKLGDDYNKSNLSN